MKNNQQIQESYWPRLASQPLQFFLRIHQVQGLSVLHLKRGSTPPSRWSLKAKQQAVWNVGTIAPALYNPSRKRHVIQMFCFNNVRSLTHESSPQLKDVCMDLHPSVTPWLDSSCGRSILLEQNSASLLNKKTDWIRFYEDAARNSMIILDQDPCYYQLYLIKYLYISTTKIQV